MNTRRASSVARLSVIGLLVVWSVSAALASAKGKENLPGPEDATARLFQLLDNSYGGKLADFCVIANTYANPSQPGQTLQYVLQVNYDKSRFYGRFSISVRGVSQLTPGQLAEYTPEQIYSFGSDVAKFEKINPGPFGEAGDLYFQANANGALAPAPVTDDVKMEYDLFLTRYIVPALEKS
jgi:hypothetical protein